MRQLLKYITLITLVFNLTSLLYALGDCVGPCGPCYQKYDAYCCGPFGICRSLTCKASACGYPFLAYRSQSWNLVRQMVGVQPFVHKYDIDSIYGNFSVALEYTRSFRPYSLAKFLFGPDLVGNSLLIQGSLVENRHPRAWLADYFGLPQDFESRVSFKPTIENVIIDFDYYLGLDNVKEGLYLRFCIPIVRTKWDLRMCEFVNNYGKLDFPPGYMNSEKIQRSELPNCFSESIGGYPIFGQDFISYDIQSIKFGYMTTYPMKKTRISDLHTTLGYNFLLDDDYHLGFNIRIGFPTSKRPSAIFLFEPLVGNGKHWELGAGITSKYILWGSQENEYNYLGIYFDATIAHLFKTTQSRSFDFIGKTNSRYMLLSQMDENLDSLQGGTNVQSLIKADYQYKRNLVPAIHYTTFNIDVRIDVQAELALKLGYVKDNWNFDLGYNLWAHTGEKFFFKKRCSCTCGCNPDEKYVIKGDSDVYGFYSSDGSPPILPIPISSSQSSADIHTGQNIRLDNLTDALVNKGLDNPQLAWALNPAIQLYLFNEDTPPILDQIYTSIQPKILSCADINFCQSPNAISHKIFAHLSYEWREKEESWRPYLGLGGEAEFGIRCNLCKFAVSQWGIWLKGGVAFE